MQTILSAKNLNIWYSRLHALKNVSLDLPKNQITALIGASGSGKSTFLRSLNRMLDTVPKAKIEGEITFNGENILNPYTDVMELRKKVGMVFQNPTPFPKSIYDNIAYGLEIQGKKKTRKKTFWHLLKSQTIKAESIEKSLDEMDNSICRSLKEAALWDEVKDRLHHSAFRLSGGQQQRLCIARAIAVRPQILLLDEPCSDLDPISTRKIEDLLLKLKENYTIIIVTHNMHQARRIADNVCFFHMGELMEQGLATKIFSNPENNLTKDYISGVFG